MEDKVEEWNNGEKEYRRQKTEDRMKTERKAGSKSMCPTARTQGRMGHGERQKEIISPQRRQGRKENWARITRIARRKNLKSLYGAPLEGISSTLVLLSSEAPYQSPPPSVGAGHIRDRF
jgi:hypothetical protein